MDNKRILNFSEFNKQYSKGDPKSAPGNDAKDVDLMTNAAAELEEPVADSGNQMDSVSSKPATTNVKTDYEQTPSSPSSPDMSNGPKSIKKDIKDEEQEDYDNEFLNKENKGSTKKTVKPIKKIQKDSGKSEEDKREESGNY